MVVASFNAARNGDCDGPWGVDIGRCNSRRLGRLRLVLAIEPRGLEEEEGGGGGNVFRNMCNEGEKHLAVKKVNNLVIIRSKYIYNIS